MRNEPTDDELLDIPEGNLLPGELTRAFTIRAEHRQKVEEQQEQQFITHLLAQRRDEDRKDDEQRELHQREAVLLQQIRARERQLQHEFEELDKRTIRLADGRRAYVDGNDYRDEQGRELHGSDRADAEQGHLEQPHAATWQEKHGLDQEWRENEKAKQQIQDLQAGKAGPDEGKILSAYEQQYSDNAGRRQRAIENQSDPSTAYTTDGDASSLASAFTAAANGPGNTDTLFPGSPALTNVAIKPQPVKPGG